MQSEESKPPEDDERLEDRPLDLKSVELVRRARAGEQNALEELLIRYRERILRLARIRMGKRVRAFMDSSDVVQETLLTAARNLDRFEPRSEGAIIQWLARILENRIRTAAAYAGREKRAPERVQRFSSIAPGAGGDAAAGGVRAPQPTPSRVAADVELQELYDRCVSELRPKYREAILLHRYAGLGWKEIAEQLSLPSEGAAREVYRRARVELALKLEHATGPGDLS